MTLFLTGVGLAIGNVIYQAAMVSPDYVKAAMITWHQACALVAFALVRFVLRRAA